MGPGTRGQEIWITDLGTDTTTRITFGPGYSIAAVWSPDAKKIAFATARNGKATLLVKDVGGNTADWTLGERALPQSWSADGRAILATASITGPLAILPLDGGDREEIDLQRAMAPRLYPDGRFIAYSSSATSPPQIFVIATLPGAGTWQVSTGGGFQPVWRRDGKELFFIAPDGVLMATDITATPCLRAGVPQKLFPTGTESLYLNGRGAYAASGDGQRFLIRVVRDAGAPAPLHGMLNWTALLKKRPAP
jgi:eukaryotic-like serine/threonine-protein kinase